MSGHDRTRRQQILREAEGYLELAMLFGEGWSLDSEKRYRLARRTLQSLDRLPLDANSGSEALYLRGQALRTLDRFAEAITPLDSASQLDPSNVNIWLSLGWCHKRSNRLDLAIESLEEALQVEPQSALVHYNLACYWSLARNNRRALQFLAQALRLDNNYRHLIDTESDFDPIRDDPRFRALTAVIV